MTADAPLDLIPDAPARRLDRVPWMEIPGTRAVVWALGRENVRFVGGCVRDMLLGQPGLDVDIATRLPPEESLARLKAAKVKVKPIGIEHGTVVAITSTGNFEITTLRRDVETDGRHAKVEFSDDWIEDALRRDFTINALSVDPDGNLYDPCGGLGDLHAGVVRFIGDPDQRLTEDVLRLLRFFRFSAWYGKGRLDRASLAAASRAAHKLDRLSGERLSTELRRLMAAPDPTVAVQAMAEHAVLRALTPVRMEPRTLSRFVSLEQAWGMQPSPVARLAAVLPGNAEQYEALAERLRFSKAETARLSGLARPLPVLGAGEVEIRQALYHSGDRDRYRYAALLAAAEGDGGDLGARLQIATHWPWPVLPIRGLDLLQIGVKPGPHLGKLLRLVEEWWVRQNFAPTREDCLAAVRKSLDEAP